MLDPGVHRRPAASSSPRRYGIRSAWCCSFTISHQSPDCRPPPRKSFKQPPEATASALKGNCDANSLHSSPSPSNKLGLGIIDPRRILSPGRVSPIDSDVPLGPPPERSSSVIAIDEQENPDPLVHGGDLSSSAAEAESGLWDQGKGLDLRMKVTSKTGGCLLMEMDSEVLCANSSYFAGMVLRSRRKVSDALKDFWEIEVEGLEDLNAFRETIEMIYDRDEMNWLMKAGVSRAIEVLEVSAAFRFERGTMSCLKYLEGVPWTEYEEEKLKSLFSRCSFSASVTADVLARLHPEKSSFHSEELAVQLIKSVANGINGSARKELQSLVNGLLSSSSVYLKDHAGLNKDGLYSVCDSCVSTLLELFREASSSSFTPPEQNPAPLVERISKQVENVNWLFEILIEKQMAADFISLWAAQDELKSLHERTSSMIRYEVSRISASVFMAMGGGRVQCCGGVRLAVLCGWFRPLLLDFGWIQRCPKGLDVRLLEEGMGQVILTLPLKMQQTLFIEWFQFFGMQGSECPNLSKAFRVWWRRSVGRGAGMQG